MSEGLKNAEERSAAFDRLMEAMLRGGDPGAVKAAEAWIADARPEDLVGAVDSAIAGGADSAALKPAVSRLVNLLSAPLGARFQAPPPGELLFASLYAENAGLTALMERGKAYAKAINAKSDGAVAREPGGAQASGAQRLGSAGASANGDSRAGSGAPRIEAAAGLGRVVGELAAVEIHYRKLENVVFPWFEAAYPRYRCVRLMWDIHDDARKGLRKCASLLEGAVRSARADFDPAPINKALGRLYFDLGAMAFREDKALFPVMMGLIDRGTADALFRETADFGFAFLDGDAAASFVAAASRPGAPGRGAAAREPALGRMPGAEGRAAAERSAGADSSGSGGDGAGGFIGSTGSIPNEVLAAIFSAMPVDMTWVDAEDKVRWFSDSPGRIFPRNKAIIGRDVRNCHPGASVGRVMAIVEAFKAGARDREAFWIESGGRFIHIEYFALRDADGTYLGTLEVSQDATGLRSLKGEKRLAD